MVQVASQHDLRELREELERELEAIEREDRKDDRQSRLLLRLVRRLEVELAELRARVLDLEHPAPPVSIDTPIRFRVFVNQLP